MARRTYGCDRCGDRRPARVAAPDYRQVIADGDGVSGTDAFRDHHRLAELRRRIEPVWRQIDCLLLPTTGTTYRVAEVEADPIGLNERLGRYTNFTNLLDLAAVAIPNGFQPSGLPAGVTLLAPAFHDPLIAAIAAAFQQRAGLPLGATGMPLPAPEAPPASARLPFVSLAVVGAHLSRQPLNYELVALGAHLRQTTRTAPEYRLYALPDDRRPGLLRQPTDGAAIEVEVWDIPTGALGAFLVDVAPPLGLGTLTLADGSAVTGFLCEPHGLDIARDITEFGGWRAWRSRRDE
jgi:allophanate hydrolase